jgi:hypothetical protein
VLWETLAGIGGRGFVIRVGETHREAIGTWAAATASSEGARPAAQSGVGGCAPGDLRDGSPPSSKSPPVCPGVECTKLRAAREDLRFSFRVGVTVRYARLRQCALSGSLQAWRCGMSLPLGSQWTIIRQGANEHIIAVTGSESPNFTAEFVDLPENHSVFTGEVRTREVTVMNLRQRADDVNYSAFHIGARQGELDEYAGFYCDVANGVSGTFRLVRRA